VHGPVAIPPAPDRETSPSSTSPAEPQAPVARWTLLQISPPIRPQVRFLPWPSDRRWTDRQFPRQGQGRKPGRRPPSAVTAQSEFASRFAWLAPPVSSIALRPEVGCISQNASVYKANALPASGISFPDYFFIIKLSKKMAEMHKECCLLPHLSYPISIRVFVQISDRTPLTLVNDLVRLKLLWCRVFGWKCLHRVAVRLKRSEGPAR
jgi:hypothetical protein